jgi:hypothetical protein
MGTSLIDSVPPAMATWLTPTAIAEATSVNAWMEVAQARLTVWASSPRGARRRGRPRAMLGARSVGMAWLKTIWSIPRVDVRALDELHGLPPPEVQRGERAEDAARLTKGAEPFTTTARGAGLTEQLRHDAAFQQRARRASIGNVGPACALRSRGST